MAGPRGRPHSCAQEPHAPASEEKRPEHSNDFWQTKFESRSLEQATLLRPFAAKCEWNWNVHCPAFVDFGHQPKGPPMTMNNPNNRNRNREVSSYTPWIIGAVVAIAAVIGIVSYNGSGTNTASNDNSPAASSTTGSGTATTGSGSSTTGSGSVGSTTGSDAPAKTPAPPAR